MSKWPEWPVILNAGVIEKLQAERDAAYARGFAAGVEQAAKARDNLTDVLETLGNPNGECGINTCPGCQYERQYAIERIQDAIRALAAPVFTVTGPVTNVVITNETTGERIY